MLFRKRNNQVTLARKQHHKNGSQSSRRSLRTFVKFMHQNELSPGQFLLKVRKETIDTKEKFGKKKKRKENDNLQTSYEISSQQK